MRFALAALFLVMLSAPLAAQSLLGVAPAGEAAAALAESARLAAALPALEAWGYDYPVTRAHNAIQLRARLQAHRARLVALLNTGRRMDDGLRFTLVAARDRATLDLATTVEIAAAAGLEASASPFVHDDGLHEIKAGLVAVGHDAHRRYDAAPPGPGREAARGEMLRVRAALAQIDARLKLV